MPRAWPLALLLLAGCASAVPPSDPGGPADVPAAWRLPPGWRWVAPCGPEPGGFEVQVHRTPDEWAAACAEGGREGQGPARLPEPDLGREAVFVASYRAPSGGYGLSFERVDGAAGPQARAVVLKPCGIVTHAIVPMRAALALPRDAPEARQPARRALAPGADCPPGPVLEISRVDLAADLEWTDPAPAASGANCVRLQGDGEGLGPMRAAATWDGPLPLRLRFEADGKPVAEGRGSSPLLLDIPWADQGTLSLRSDGGEEAPPVAVAQKARLRVTGEAAGAGPLQLSAPARC